jgi:predicted peroxiredoxin
MMQTLVHLTHGPDQPDRVARAFQVAMAASRQGHAVTLFLTGGALRFLRGRAPDWTGASGPDHLHAAFEAVVASGAKVYLSGASAQTQGLAPVEVAGSGAMVAQPRKLAELAAGHDQVFSH